MGSALKSALSRQIPTVSVAKIVLKKNVISEVGSALKSALSRQILDTNIIEPTCCEVRREV